MRARVCACSAGPPGRYKGRIPLEEAALLVYVQKSGRKTPKPKLKLRWRGTGRDASHDRVLGLQAESMAEIAVRSASHGVLVVPYHHHMTNIRQELRP